MRVKRLHQWPVQIKLVPVRVPCFEGADLPIAADCTAYAYVNFLPWQVVTVTADGRIKE